MRKLSVRHQRRIAKKAAQGNRPKQRLVAPTEPALVKVDIESIEPEQFVIDVVEDE